MVHESSSKSSKSSKVLGQAQTDRILTPAVTGSAALVEIADLAVAQQGTKAQQGEETGDFPWENGEKHRKTKEFPGKLGEKLKIFV